jgi:hypothetical protein
VSITSPANGATVSGTTAVKATASDSAGVASVAFSVDGTVKSGHRRQHGKLVRNRNG